MDLGDLVALIFIAFFPDRASEIFTSGAKPTVSAAYKKGFNRAQILYSKIVPLSRL